MPDDWNNERRPVQGTRYTDYPRSDTELARIVAEHHEWDIDMNDAIYHGSLKLAESPDDLARKLSQLGWIQQNPSSGVLWGSHTSSKDVAQHP